MKSRGQKSTSEVGVVDVDYGATLNFDVNNGQTDDVNSFGISVMVEVGGVAVEDAEAVVDGDFDEGL